MTQSFYNGISGFKSFQNAIDIWGNNISNINTTGFKENIPEFSTLFSSTISNSNVTSDIGFSSTTNSTAMDTSLGSLVKSDNPFDLALEGKGWFKVNYNGKDYYTRDGNFKRDKNGYLVNDNGAYLLVANANNIIKTDKGYEVDTNIKTDNLVLNNKFSPISLPNDLIMPASATKNVKISKNLLDDEIITSASPAKEESDFSALYNNNNQDMKIRNGDSFIVGYGDNISYNNGNLEYEICIEDDKIDGKNVNYDFNINGKNINLTLPDGSTKEEIQNALKKELDNNNINNEITTNGIKILNPQKIVISSNTPLVNNVSAEKLTYNSNPTNQFEFNTIKSFETSIQSLVSNIYSNVLISFDTTKGAITLNNNSNETINSYILKDNSTNENLYKALTPLFENTIPQNSSSSEKLKINTQSLEGNIYSQNGDKDTLSFNFSKEKVLNNQILWNVEINSKDPNGNVLESKNYTLTFDKNGKLISPTSVSINSPQKINIDLSNISSYQKVENQSPNDFQQDGIATGYLKYYNINENGNIEAVFSNSKTSTLGQIPVLNFKNEQGLASIGENLFEATSNSGKEEIFSNNGEYIPTAKIKSGYLEQSNVNLSNAMTELIVNQKAFNAIAKTVTTSDQMIQKAINMKR